MLAGEPAWMISRSVAQMATASMRTRTSARPGMGVGLSRSTSSSGSPRTQAFIRPGTGNSGDILTPEGSYIGSGSPVELEASMRKRISNGHLRDRNWFLVSDDSIVSCSSVDMSHWKSHDPEPEYRL